jgi:hypothetical protein
MSDTSRLARQGLWVAVLLGPLIVNAVVHAALVAPQQATVRAWQETQWLLQQKPKLETLLAQSHHLLSDWGHTSFTIEDPAEPVQVIQRLAGRHRVRVVSAKTGEQEFSDSVKGRRGKRRRAGSPDPSASGVSITPLVVEVTGSFGRLAQWLSDIETHAGFQIESLELAPEDALNLPHRLTLKLTARLERP